MKIQKNAEVLIYMNKSGEVRLVNPNLPNEPMLFCPYESEIFMYSGVRNELISILAKSTFIYHYELVGYL
jgi:hypothetical protein